MTREIQGRGKLSIVIPVHNNLDISCRCLEALARAVAHLDHEIILMDNASDVGTTPLKERGDLFRSFQLCRSDVNLAYSVINNRGAAIASGDWLLFLNNDVFVQPESIECMLQCLAQDSHIGIVGAKLLFPGETAIQHGGMRQMLWGYASNYGVGADPADPRFCERCDRFAVTGAMMCVARNAFQETRGFDERYVWGYEDVDLCLRVRAAGFSVLYCPEATGVHVGSATLREEEAGTQSQNYQIYRETWNHVLVPREQDYMSALKSEGIRRIVVFGTGVAARGLAAILAENHVQIVAFTSSRIQSKGESYLGRTVLPLTSLAESKFDRLMVASQFFFQLEPTIRGYDPARNPIFPVLD